jgi:ribosomal protein S6--L-glutamate ligase
VEVARARGQDIDAINSLHVHMNIISSKPTLWHGGRMLAHYDAVIPRVGASITQYGLAVLRQFEMQGVFLLNESVVIRRSRDKLRPCNCWREGIGLPVTAFAQDPRRAEDVIKEVGGTPCVIKLLEGTRTRRDSGGDRGLGQIHHRGIRRRRGGGNANRVLAIRWRGELIAGN